MKFMIVSQKDLISRSVAVRVGDKRSLGERREIDESEMREEACGMLVEFDGVPR